MYVEGYLITVRTGVRYPAAPPYETTRPKGGSFCLEMPKSAVGALGCEQVLESQFYKHNGLKTKQK